MTISHLKDNIGLKGFHLLRVLVACELGLSCGNKSGISYKRRFAGGRAKQRFCPYGESATI
jgi:hypothetical protein